MARGEIYAQLSCDYYDNAKMIAAGDDAELLYVRALCLANRLLTDGTVLPEHLVALRLAKADRRAARLVEVGLWAPRAPEPGWTIVGWAERNRSRIDVMDRRAQAVERKQRERDRRRAERDNGSSSTVTDVNGHAHVTRDSDDTSRSGHAPIDQRTSINEHRSLDTQVRENLTVAVATSRPAPPAHSRNARNQLLTGHHT